jgi:hypothetical protein
MPYRIEEICIKDLVPELNKLEKEGWAVSQFLDSSMRQVSTYESEIYKKVLFFKKAESYDEGKSWPRNKR